MNRSYAMTRSVTSTSLERRHVKNYKGSELLSNLQASKLAYHNFMDAGRRRKPPGSEMKDSEFHTATAVARVLAFDCAHFSNPDA